MYLISKECRRRESSILCHLIRKYVCAPCVYILWKRVNSFVSVTAVLKYVFFLRFHFARIITMSNISFRYKVSLRNVAILFGYCISLYYHHRIECRITYHKVSWGCFFLYGSVKSSFSFECLNRVTTKTSKTKYKRFFW